jgi:hypothetical protein
MGCSWTWRAAARSGHLLKRATELEQRDDRYAPFATELRKRTKGFHTRKIRQFLEGEDPQRKPLPS